jgi:hypothetical protein
MDQIMPPKNMDILDRFNIKEIDLQNSDQTNVTNLSWQNLEDTRGSALRSRGNNTAMGLGRFEATKSQGNNRVSNPSVTHMPGTNTPIERYESEIPGESRL